LVAGTPLPRSDLFRYPSELYESLTEKALGQVRQARRSAAPSMGRERVWG